MCSKRSHENPDLKSLREAVRANSKSIQDFKKARKSVAFFAYLSKNWNKLGRGTILVYDKVNLNDGNGYNKADGKFTAPSSGLYVFHVSTGVVDKTHVSVEVVLNRNVRNIAWADSYDHQDRTFATTVTPLRLKKGDVVSTRIGYAGGRYIESTGNIRTSFSGVKIN